MVEYTFMDLRKDLDIGHEIHFLYKGNQYSISCSKYGWHLSKFYGEFQTFSNPHELLNNGSIEGHRLEDIWQDVEVTIVF